VNPPAAGRPTLLRIVGMALIAVGGLFLILGWGLGHHEWARTAGWLFTGFGFAFELVRDLGRREAGTQKRGERNDDV
jgi:hypothetical protein